MDVHDAVLIDIKGDFDLGNSSGRRSNAIEMELAEFVAIFGHLALSLKDLDQDSWLVVSVGGEGLSLLCWNGGVTRNEDSHDSSGCFDTQGQRGDIQQDHVLHVLAGLIREDGSLNCSSVGHGFVGVDRLIEGTAIEEVLEKLLDLRDTSGPTDENDVVDLRLRDSGVCEHALDGRDALLEEVKAELLELGSGDRHVEVLVLA